MGVKRTELENIREQSKLLFDVISFQEASDCIGMDGLIISHPYANSAISMSKDGKFLDLVKNEEDATTYRKQIFQAIDDSDDLFRLLFLLNKPYYLYWLKIIKPFLSPKDFTSLFREIWVLSENPNNDINVPLREVVSWLKKYPKDLFMDEEEKKLYYSLPDTFTVYRGVSKNRNLLGLSYTLDKDKAIWFQERFKDDDNPGYLIELEVSKDNTFFYLNNRDEKEILVDSFKYINEINKQAPCK